MLKQRVLTAIAMLLVLLPALFYPAPEPFCWVALVLMAAASWEWARLNGMNSLQAFLPASACVLLCLLTWLFVDLDRSVSVLWVLTGSFWVLAGAWLMMRGVDVWAKIPAFMRQIFGVILLALTWLAVAQARVIGVNFLISVMALVWVADIAAYFSGRAWGGKLIYRKLAASISPGKSWEGVFGGALGVGVLALAWTLADRHLDAAVPSLYTVLWNKSGALLFLGVIFMVTMSVVGDLLESLVKRSAGVKDSSKLLPGHGGVLDRIDALLPTLPLAMMIYALTS